MNVIMPLGLGVLVLVIIMLTLFFLRPGKPVPPQTKPIPDNTPEPPRDFGSETATEIAVRPEKTPHMQAEPIPELPRFYGVDRLILMARDPYWLYAYWEITATKQEDFIHSYGPEAWGGTQPVVRVYDVTGIEFNGLNANWFKDIGVDENADNWHIFVGEPDRDFCVDLGRMFPDGKFVTLLRSNTVSTPRASLSDRMDEEWMWIEGLHRTLKLIPGLSSPLIIEEITKRAGGLPLGVSSPGFGTTLPPER